MLFSLNSDSGFFGDSRGRKQYDLKKKTPWYIQMKTWQQKYTRRHQQSVNALLFV